MLQSPENRPALILASGSPRRRELLALLGRPFKVVVPEIDETPRSDEDPRTFAQRMAKEKAHALSEEGIVIAADTIVVLEGKILGKPTDAADAREMLCALSGRVHEVITGVCVKTPSRTTVFSVETEVVFRVLEEGEIRAYVESGEPMDKAGAYAIQSGAAPMIRAINGSYTNVVGLPLCELQNVLATSDDSSPEIPDEIL